jgi:hypothetical protein
LVALITVLGLVGTGCYSTEGGGVKAGMPFVKDSVVSRYERPPAQVHAAALAVIKKQGTLTSDDSVTHVIRGRIDNRTVWIKVSEDDPAVTTVTVQARTKMGMADVDLASEVDKLIYGTLVTQ